MELKYFQCVQNNISNEEYLFPTLRIARIVSGDGKWKIGEKVYPCKKDTILLLNNLTPRKMVEIQLSPIVIDIFEFSPLALSSRPRFLSAFYCGNAQILNNSEEFISNMLGIVSKEFSKTQNSDFIFHQMQAIFALIEDKLESIVYEKGQIKLALNAADFIWSNYAETVNVTAISKELNVSKNHLEKVFKSVHSISVGEYLRRIRVYNAITMLKSHPDLSVLQIALSCGFNSSSGFYKTFKSVTGKMPRRD